MLLLPETEKKQCHKCLQVKTFGDFHPYKNKKNLRHSWCKTCEGIYTKEYNRSNRGKETRHIRWIKNRNNTKEYRKELKRQFHLRHPEKNLQYDLKKHYKMTLEDRENLLKSQDYGCRICGTKTPTGRGWHIDHNHACCPGSNTCGKCIRGILCHHCNLILANARDSVEILKRAIMYLGDNNGVSEQTSVPAVE